MQKLIAFYVVPGNLLAKGIVAIAISGIGYIPPLLAQQTQPTPQLPASQSPSSNQFPAPPVPLAGAPAEQLTSIRGTVAQYLMNPDGLVDGLLLADNTVVRFPPHQSQQLIQIAKPQDAVRVDGVFEFQGVIHASTITNASTQQSIVDTPPSTQNPLPLPNPAVRQPMSSSGIIKALTHAPGGETDGAVLNDGTYVHVPPPVGMQYATLFRVGGSLAASGYGTANSYGRSFEATAIGPSVNQMQNIATLDNIRGFPGPRG